MSGVRRWTSNLGAMFLNSAALRLLFPAAAVGFAMRAPAHGWGLSNLVAAPFWVPVPGSIAILELAIYLQHVMFHAAPILWRLCRTHHADLDYDVATGVRFHPIEILPSMLIKFAVIGAQAVAVVIFEVVLNATTMFNHGNLRLSIAFDRVAPADRHPDMRRVHHSVGDHEVNSNFGFNLSLWNRLLGAYMAQPDTGHKATTLGIRDYRALGLMNGLPGRLVLPFLGRIAGYAINRRAWTRSS